jgi:hypothetical protein
MPTLECDFTIGDHVYIDGCRDLCATVTAVQWRTQSGTSYELGWICGGKSEIAMIEGWRLSRSEKAK